MAKFCEQEVIFLGSATLFLTVFLFPSYQSQHLSLKCDQNTVEPLMKDHLDGRAPIFEPFQPQLFL